MRGEFFHIAKDLAATPREGECITNRWWAVHPEKGLAFYFLRGRGGSESPSPQCNQDERVVRHNSERINPGHIIEFVPLVFLEHAEAEMRRLKLTPEKKTDP